MLCAIEEECTMYLINTRSSMYCSPVSNQPYTDLNCMNMEFKKKHTPWKKLKRHVQTGSEDEECGNQRLRFGFNKF